MLERALGSLWRMFRPVQEQKAVGRDGQGMATGAGGPAGAWGGGTRLGAAQRGRRRQGTPGIRLGAGGDRPLKEPGKGYWLLVRRSIAKPAYYVCFGPVDTKSGGTGAGGRNSLDHRRMSKGEVLGDGW